MQPRISPRLSLFLLCAAGLISLSAWDATSPSSIVGPGIERAHAPLATGEASVGWVAARAAMQIRLPVSADEAASVQDTESGVEARFRLEGASAVLATRSGEEASYVGALGEGTTLVLKPIERGIEDTILFEAQPRDEQVSYLLDTGGFAGARKVGETLELLDAQGTPRLRVEPPTIAGVDGRVAQASLDVSDCAIDTSTLPPWGRAVTAPGAERCRLTVRWADRGVAYPAVLDPAWTSTSSSMSSGRAYPGMSPLPDGRVLVTGGKSCADSTCPSAATADIYDPATQTWAATASMNEARNRFSMVALPSVGAIVFGGDRLGSALSSVEIYDAATGTWQAQPAMAKARADSTATMLKDGESIVVLGGALTLASPEAAAERFNTTTRQWSAVPPLAQARFLHTASLLPNGRVMVVGGTKCMTCFSAVGETELYDPETNTFSIYEPANLPRFGHRAVNLEIDGEEVVMLLGGLVAGAEYFRPSTEKWTTLESMHIDRTFPGALKLDDGSVLVVGGATLPTSVALTSTERFDPVSKTWQLAGNTSVGRATLALAPLPGGGALAAGGLTGVITMDVAVGVSSSDVFLPLGQGAPCTSNGECSSFACADGICCDSACTGECMSCLAAKKGAGVDGTCGPVALDTDPDDECAAQPVSACSTTGACDGAGKCSIVAVGTPCGAVSCAAGTLSFFGCAGEGRCESMTESCAPYMCGDPTACGSSCDSDLQCAITAHCESATKTCEPDRATGVACSRSSECLSGSCVDGVCCSTPCDSICQACSAATKASGDEDGTCGPAKEGSDPHNDCEDEPVSSCDRNGLCDGAGQCQLYAAGTLCQAPDCTGNSKTELFANAYSCDGSGTCGASNVVTCGLYMCASGGCGTNCTEDGDCVEHAYCSGGSCVEKKDLGVQCSTSAECGAGFCVDGVCCNGPCDQTCEACDVANAAGYCVPVSGAPHGDRERCPSAPEGEPCRTRSCDGVIRESCEGFVGPSVMCREPACADGLATLAAVCDGKGNCAETEQLKCEPFVCDGVSKACAVKCTSDAGCAPKFQCDTTVGDCVPRTGASCDGAHSLISPDGTVTDCSPYICEGATCKPSCSSVLDCVAPNICDELSRACVPAAPNPVSDAGGCAMSTGALSTSPWALLVGLGLVAALRRRQAA